MSSHFDTMFHAFKCEKAQCGYEFKKALRSLVHPNEVTCPECGTSIDIREAKLHGEIGKEFDTADQLDKLDKLNKKK